MSQNLGLPKLHRSGGSRIFFATFFIESKLPSRATEIEMSQKIISKNLLSVAYIKKQIKLILSTAMIKVNLHDIVFLHTKEIVKSQNHIIPFKKHAFTQ